MSKLSITLINKRPARNIYKISDINNEDIYLKLDNIRLPFNIQKYNNNNYINGELFYKDKLYSQNVGLINLLENHIKEVIRSEKKFISCIKDKENGIHMRFMVTKHTKTTGPAYLQTINLNNLSDNRDKRYDIIIKPLILWENESSYGINYFIYKIIEL